MELLTAVRAVAQKAGDAVDDGGWLKPGRANGRFLGITETYCVQFVRFDSNCKTVLAVRDSSSVPLCPTEPYSLYLWMR